MSYLKAVFVNTHSRVREYLGLHLAPVRGLSSDNNRGVNAQHRDLYALAHAYKKHWAARHVLIEESGNGIALLQQLRHDILRVTKPRYEPSWRAIADTPKVSKITPRPRRIKSHSA